MARARRVTPTVSGLSGPQGAQPVTNLTITGPHTYYVTNTSILVHNCGAGGSNIAQNKASGDSVADAIAGGIPGAQREVTLSTSEGVRRVDIVTPGGQAIESKVGAVTLTESVSRQVAKDVALRADPESDVKSLVWQFTPSPVTGKGGPSGPLRALLESEGIEIR